MMTIHSQLNTLYDTRSTCHAHAFLPSHVALNGATQRRWSTLSLAPALRTHSREPITAVVTVSATVSNKPRARLTGGNFAVYPGAAARVYGSAGPLVYSVLYTAFAFSGIASATVVKILTAKLPLPRVLALMAALSLGTIGVTASLPAV